MNDQDLQDLRLQVASLELRHRLLESLVSFSLSSQLLSLTDQDPFLAQMRARALRNRMVSHLSAGDEPANAYESRLQEELIQYTKELFDRLETLILESPDTF